MATTAKEILEKTSMIKNSDSISQQRVKGTITGGLIGMGVGLLIGYSKKYNLMGSAVFGLIIGTVAAQIILPKK